MSTATTWRVVIHDDRVNTISAVIHMVQVLCGRDVRDATQVAMEVHHYGSAEVTALPEQSQAEHLVVAFQRRGLAASVRRES